jgi:hypothetical protein
VDPLQGASNSLVVNVAMPGNFFDGRLETAKQVRAGEISSGEGLDAGMVVFRGCQVVDRVVRLLAGIGVQVSSMLVDLLKPVIFTPFP